MCQRPLDFISLLLQYAVPFSFSPFRYLQSLIKNLFRDVVLRLKDLWCLFCVSCWMCSTFHEFHEFHVKKIVGFGMFWTFPWPAHDKGDAWVKRMIITSDKSSSVFWERSWDPSGDFFEETKFLYRFMVTVEPGISGIKVDVGVYLCIFVPRWVRETGFKSLHLCRWVIISRDRCTDRWPKHFG